MTPELYQRLRPLYEKALDYPKEQRQQFLDEACHGDADLREALLALLVANDEEAGALDRPIIHFENRSAGGARSFADGDLIVGRFKIVRYLAAGGMGEVYEAQDLFLQDLHVALKTIRAHIAADAELRRRFKREVVLAREVSHPNLCPIYDIFQCDTPPPGFLFLTMKLLPGGTLTSLMRSGATIPLQTKENIAKQIARGLAAIHAAGIVHGDIKSNNIMLDTINGDGSNPRVWITDFGLARAYESDSTVSAKPTLAGTPGYIAPELYQGQPPSQASDLFAYGVVLHELFTGRKPISPTDAPASTASSLLVSSGTPAYCAELIAECLGRDPARRCKAFELALRRMGGAQERPEFWTRRRFLGAAAASAGVAATGTWWKWEAIENALHPLPQKRFVALLPWPKAPDSQAAPMLTGVLSAIKSELARAEAFDRNFFVIAPEDLPQDLAAAAHLKEICDPLGANLVLAASGAPRKHHFELLLRVLDPVSGRALRAKKLTCALGSVTTLPEKAVQAAAALLNLGQYVPSKEGARPQTQSAEAFAAFQTAENLMTYPFGRSLEEAIVKYKEALDLDPKYALAHANLAVAYARLYVTKGDSSALDLARGNSQRALALDPHLVEGFLAGSIVSQDTGDESGALDQIAKALQLDPSSPQALMRQAQVYSDQGRWIEAEDAYRKVLERRPNWWVTYNELAVAFDRQGRHHDAIQALRAASVAVPENAFVLCNLGTEYLEVGDFAEAARILQSAFTIEPDYDVAAATISFALRSQGKYKEALPFALKATQLNPASDFNWLELGDCYSSLLGHKSEAKRAYSRAADEAEKHLQTNPADGSTWMLLALYKVKSGAPHDALSLIQKAESTGANDMDSQLYKARVLELLGKRDEALAALAACFAKGAHDFQLLPFPDMNSLRRDTRYRAMTKSFGQQEKDSS
jgi:tetratricopeptide (TPR) repeat protein